MNNYLITYRVGKLNYNWKDFKEQTITALWQWQARLKFNNEPKHKYAGKAGERHDIISIQQIPAERRWETEALYETITVLGAIALACGIVGGCILFLNF